MKQRKAVTIRRHIHPEAYNSSAALPPAHPLVHCNIRPYGLRCFVNALAK